VSHAVALSMARTGWRSVLVGMAAIAVAYAPIVPPLAREWATYPTLSHGFAIPLIAAYLVWSRRGELAGTPVEPAWRGLPVVGVGLTLYTLGIFGSEPFLARVSLPVTLAGGIFLLAGPAATRQVLPGVAYLIFMVPLPYVTIKQLTRGAILFDAMATAALLPWLGVPVHRNGTFLHLPNMILEVADACSSIPAVASLLALGAAYGVVRRRRAWLTGVLLLAAIPFGIGSNLLRITLTAAGVYYLGPVAINNVVHSWHGTTVFLMTFGALVLLDAGLARRSRPSA
jgi:exosortase